MHTLANSEDPDDAAFHQSLHCLLRLKQSSVTDVHLHLEILTCNTLISTMDYPRFTVSNQIREFIRLKLII